MEIEKQQATIDELVEALNLLIDFIPQGWEVPLGYMGIVERARQATSKAKGGSKMKWKLIGKLKSGKDVYQNEDGELAVENDHRVLVEPTAEERGQIFRELRR